MTRFERTVTIRAPVEKVFPYIVDPASQLDWFPGLIEVETVRGRGGRTEYHWTHQSAGFHLHGTTIYTLYVPNKRIVAETRGMIRSSWDWTFESSAGGTKVVLVLTYAVPLPILGGLAEDLILERQEREADRAVRRIKERLEPGGLGSGA